MVEMIGHDILWGPTGHFFSLFWGAPHSWFQGGHFAAGGDGREGLGGGTYRGKDGRIGEREGKGTRRKRGRDGKGRGLHLGCWGDRRPWAETFIQAAHGRLHDKNNVR